MKTLSERIQQELNGEEAFFERLGFERLQNGQFTNVSNVRYGNLSCRKHGNNYTFDFTARDFDGGLSAKEFVVIAYLKAFDTVDACIKHPLGLIEQKYQLTDITPDVLAYCREHQFALRATKYELCADIDERFDFYGKTEWEFDGEVVFRMDLLEHY